MRELNPPPTKITEFNHTWRDWLNLIYEAVKPSEQVRTWTPVLSDGTNNATSSEAFGYYTRTGRQVSFTGRLTTTSLGSVNGNLRITGLPFTSQNIANSDAPVNAGLGSGLAITAGYVVSGLVANNTTYIVLYVWNATTGSTAMQDTEWTADGGLIFSGIYYI